MQGNRRYYLVLVRPVVDQLAKQAAQIALRLTALPDSGLCNDPQILKDIEEMALGILKAVAAARVTQSSETPVGETRGVWRAMQPLRRQ